MGCRSSVVCETCRPLRRSHQQLPRLTGVLADVYPGAAGPLRCIFGACTHATAPGSSQDQTGSLFANLALILPYPFLGPRLATSQTTVVPKLGGDFIVNGMARALGAAFELDVTAGE